MNVKVLFFAAARDLAGTGEAMITVPAESTVETLKRELLRVFPKLIQVLPRSSLAVNREFAVDTHFLQEGDECAVVPPVSGG